jgi:hypothetical protein
VVASGGSIHAHFIGVSFGARSFPLGGACATRSADIQRTTETFRTKEDARQILPGSLPAPVLGVKEHRSRQSELPDVHVYAYP